MIRILHMIGSLASGGSQTMIMNLYRNIDRNEMQFDFIVDHPEDMIFDEEIKSLGGKIYVFPTFKGYNIVEIRKAWTDFFNNHPEYKVLHSHVRSYASIYLPIAKKYGLKTVIHSHSTSNGTGFPAFVKQIMQYPLRFQADCYLSCSELAGEWLFGEKIVQSDKFQILPNAIDIKAYQFNADARNRVRNELNIGDEEILFGHVGRFHASKNPIFLLKVFQEIHKRMPNSKLVMVGDGELRNKIETAIHQLKIEKDVFLLGTRKDVKDIVQAMDCFLFPSCWEGVPVTVIEAQASGLPCFVSDTVTKDVGISEQVHYLPIDQGTEPWATAILNTELKRKDVVDKIKQAGFDIEDTSRWLANLYSTLGETK